MFSLSQSLSSDSTIPPGRNGSSCQQNSSTLALQLNRHNLDLVSQRLSFSVFSIKDVCHLLQGTTLGLKVEEVGNDQKGDEEDYVSEVVLPTNASKRDWVYKHVEDTCDNARDLHDT
ncbi:hypothetical protein FPOAC2_00023 [Fusarium poae]